MWMRSCKNDKVEEARRGKLRSGGPRVAGRFGRKSVYILDTECSEMWRGEKGKVVAKRGETRRVAQNRREFATLD